MQGIVSFAAENDLEQVRSLLQEHHMDVYGDISEHVVLKGNGAVCAVAKLVETGKNCFHLETLAVDNERRKEGLGGLLLDELTAHPWRFCQPEAEAPSGAYEVATVARGDAMEFYRRHGFSVAEWSVLAPLYQGQCDECPDREECRPVPMITRRWRAGGF